MPRLINRDHIQHLVLNPNMIAGWRIPHPPPVPQIVDFAFNEAEEDPLDDEAEPVPIPKPKVPPEPSHATLPPKILKPFRLPYDTWDEARMRLEHTVILFAGEPVYVHTIAPFVDGDNSHWIAKLVTADGAVKTVKDRDIHDTRTPPAGYITMRGTPMWFSRVPARKSQQGLNTQNVLLYPVRHTQPMRNRDWNIMDLLGPLKYRAGMRWSVEYLRLLQNKVSLALRLSDDVAVYPNPQTGNIHADWKNRRLGVVSDGHVLVDAIDFRTSWVCQGLQDVGLVPKEQEGERG